MENARLERQRRRRIMFGKQFKRKQYEIQNTLQNKAAESRKHRKIVIAEKEKKKEKRDKMVVNHKNVIEPWNFGSPSHVCVHCGSILWYEERTLKSKRPRNPKFSLCCMQGKVKLPLLRKAPPLIDELLD